MALFEESADAYAEGRFEDAATLLRRAYDLDQEPVLLYNLARALESAADFDAALDAYERFLASGPEASERATVEERVAALRERIERLRAEREVDDRPAPPPPPRQIDPIPWIVAGASLIPLGIGIGLGVAAQSANDQAIAEEEHRLASEHLSRARGLELGANIAFIAAGVVFATGLIWGIVSLTGGDDDDSMVRLTPNGVALLF